MGIKIGLTGHSRGFGAVIMDILRPQISEINKYSAEKAEFVGFSRSNGYDITNKDQVESIFENNELTCIINNADSGNGQMNVATLAHKYGIPCINVGEKITEVDVSNMTQDHIDKKAQKMALKEFSEENGQEYITFGYLAPHIYIDINPEVQEFNMNVERAASVIIGRMNELGLI